MKSLHSRLNLAGQTAIEVIVTSVPEGSTAEQFFESIVARMKEVAEPAFKSYLEGLNLKETLSKIESMPELENFETIHVTTDLKKVLADVIDEFQLTEGEKFYVFSLFLTSFHSSAAHYVNSYLNHRASELLNPKRIVLP